MNTREPDLQTLRKEYRGASPEDRKRIEHAAYKIRNETGKIRSMREALVKAHRSGNSAEIKDIHEFIRNKREYSNGR